MDSPKKKSGKYRCNARPSVSDVSELHAERAQLARRNAFHSSLSSVFREKENSIEFVPLLQRISEEIITLLSANTSYISVVHESKDFMEVVATPPGSSISKGFQHQMGDGIAGTAWKTGEMQVVSDYPKYNKKISKYKSIQQVCAIPIKVGGEVVAVIGIVYMFKNDKFLERIEEFEEFAKQVTILIENAKLIESARTELVRTEALYKLSDALIGSNDVKAVFDIACKAVINACETKFVQIYHMPDEQLDGISRTEAVSGNDLLQHSVTDFELISLEFEKTPKLDPVDDPQCIQNCIETGKPFLVSRSSSGSSASNQFDSAKSRHEIRSSIYMPLVHEELVWGVLVAHRDMSKPDFNDSDINMVGAISTQTTVAVHRHRLQSRIQHQAYHDSLTELPNRLNLEQSLTQAVERADISKERIAVLFIDLDGFKSVNDIFGHAVGDDLLKSVSVRLQKIIGNKGLLARMGGDEFAVLLQNVVSPESVMDTSEKIINMLSAEHDVEKATVNVGASIGISLFPDDSTSAADLLQNADIAMYQAKGKGKNCAQYFSVEMATRFRERVEIEQELANAVVNGELRLVYQPKVNVSNQRVYGVEALLRWNHQLRGEISPVDFIPIAEESGLILPIGEWVLEEACRQTVEWQKAGLENLSMAVNVSVQQFNTGNFVDTVKQALSNAGLDANCLSLEITESCLMVDVDRTVEKLQELKTLGVSVAIDDFGTGFSSLRYLQDLPLDYLKIDRSFISMLDELDPQKSLVNTIIGMAESFDLETVAEGVETVEQLEKVTALGCDCIQGFLFSKPVEREAIPATVSFIDGQLIPEKLAA